MFRGVLLSAVGCFALVAPALAADIYSPGLSSKDTPVYVPVTTWTGFYLGINGGYGGYSGLPFTNDTFIAVPGANGNDFRRISGSTYLSGGFGGGQLGYNFQSGSLVYGFETDIQGSGITGRAAQSQLVSFSGYRPKIIGRFATANTDVNYFGTVRARLGYAFGGTLLYATGGFAYGGVNSAYSFDDTSGSTGYSGSVSNSATQTGWTAGAGIEYKLSPSWSLKGEYQFVDLGSNSKTAPLLTPACATPGYVFKDTSDVQFHTVRIGLNYHFNEEYEPLPLK